MYYIAIYQAFNFINKNLISNSNQRSVVSFTNGVVADEIFD